MVFWNKTSETRECARHVGNVRRVKRGDFLYICAFHSLRYLYIRFQSLYLDRERKK